ncbi:hypothetical protein [Flavobacterium poyangense]|uniref:hypothetical protein n=1 Tax=Flavobacterium poyangense TaxID=2204302 RepID=UPI0014218AA3|nr:hypothetical protein [Flavobacterium sp. JXAS1]
MIILKRIIPIVVSFSFFSCSSSYLKNYDPINTFLELENVSRDKNYILRTKESNYQTLRIFNRGEGAKHIVNPNTIDYTSKLFDEKHWNKLYAKYSSDTITRYWSDKDFQGYKFVEGKREQLFTYTFSKKNPDLKDVKYVVVLSEPIYYWDKKYVMFFYRIDNYLYSADPQIVVVMKKEGKKWVLVERIGDYSCSGCL